MTSEFYQANESGKIPLWLENFDMVHVRKPQATAKEVWQFMKEIPVKYHPRMVNHGHMDLWENFAWRSPHFSRRYGVNRGWKKTYSFSCHSLDEIKTKSHCEYVFLSPVYDSLSKEGYKSSFLDKTALKTGITELKKEGLQTKIIALGGVTLGKKQELKELGFDGLCLKGGLDFVYEK